MDSKQTACLLYARADLLRAGVELLARQVPLGTAVVALHRGCNLVAARAQEREFTPESQTQESRPKQSRIRTVLAAS